MAFLYHTPIWIQMESLQEEPEQDNSVTGPEETSTDPKADPGINPPETVETLDSNSEYQSAIEGAAATAKAKSDDPIETKLLID